MEFRILGPLEAIEDGCGLDLGALKQRALLAVLLLEVWLGALARSVTR